jgi:hypothetical protein
MPLFQYLRGTNKGKNKHLFSKLLFFAWGVALTLFILFLSTLFPYPISLISFALVSVIMLRKYAGIPPTLAWLLMMGLYHDIEAYPAMPLLTMQLLCALLVFEAVGHRFHIFVNISAAAGMAGVIAWTGELITHNGSGIINIKMMAISIVLTALTSVVFINLASLIMHVVKKLFRFRYAP